jgi:hypothetical protein
MCALLLSLGGLTSAVGLALVATFLTAHETPLDPELMTSGVVAIVGGLILVGLGLVIRALQRLEVALVAEEPMRRGGRPVEAAATPMAVPAPALASIATAAVEQAVAPARAPASPKPKAEPRPQFVAPPAPPLPPPAPPVEEPALERFREKFPALVRFDHPAVSEESAAPAVEVQHAEGEVVDVRNISVAARVNGAAPARATTVREAVARRVSTPPQPVAARQKASVFEAFWPNGQRPQRSGRPAAAPHPAPTQAPIHQAPIIAVPGTAAPAPRRVELAHQEEPAAPRAAGIHEPPPERHYAHDVENAGPVSVLKSGVVEGMAYTLYSDGSIEAELPQGRLRFGSITALRHHMEGEA